MRTLRQMIPLFLVAAILVAGCNKQDSDAKKPEAKEAGHEAHHGGCLNAIETCEVGHAEIKIEGDLLRCWFVGGESHTDQAVRVTDKEIVLAVKLADGQLKSLTLQPKPNQLANEKVGDCSYFEGHADWLKGITEFKADGKVSCRGKENRALTIEFPKGYDPD